MAKHVAGHALDVLMARAMDWAVYRIMEDGSWIAVKVGITFPYMVIDVHDNYHVEYSKSLSVDWRPSTNIAHAFEVHRDGWEWSFDEGGTRQELVTLCADLYVLTQDSEDVDDGELYSEIVYLKDFKLGNGKIDIPAAYALARCRCVASWLEAQGGV